MLNHHLFLLNDLISNQYLNKFENNLFKTGNHDYSSIFVEDSLTYIKEAEKIRTDIIDGKNFLESGGAYNFSFLYPKIIYFFNKIINDNEIMVSEDRIQIKNYKLAQASLKFNEVTTYTIMFTPVNHIPNTGSFQIRWPR